MTQLTKWTRFAFHFEPETGWMNDPNGLIFYQGKYHAFFQHNPHSARWDRMHWGHAVSEDLVHWEQLPIALFPEEPYENDGGCFSGSAVEKDGRLYLFYTSVSRELGQTQSVAWSDDGIHFEKYPGNPVIRENPLGYDDFRDPKVTKIDGTYYMVVGTGTKTSGKVLLFTSEDLLQWSYVGILFEEEEYAPCMECPDFFKLGEDYVLMFSKMGEPERSTHFVVGDFVNGRLVNYRISRPEWGPDFYAPQTFEDPVGHRMMIGWLYHWGKEAPDGCPFAGALSVARQLFIKDRVVSNYPAEPVQPLLKESSAYVQQCRDELVLFTRDGTAVRRHVPGLHRVEILEDTKALEVFVNEGALSFSWWLE